MAFNFILGKTTEAISKWFADGNIAELDELNLDLTTWKTLSFHKVGITSEIR
jgi:hypothetical protein